MSWSGARIGSEKIIIKKVQIKIPGDLSTAPTGGCGAAVGSATSGAAARLSAAPTALLVAAAMSAFVLPGYFNFTAFPFTALLLSAHSTPVRAQKAVREALYALRPHRCAVRRFFTPFTPFSLYPFPRSNIHTMSENYIWL